MFISIIPMFFVPEGGVSRETENGSAQEPDRSASTPRVLWIFLIAMVFINFGRNSIALIQVQYLVLESGFAVSSKVLSYIVNTQSVAMILTGLAAGWFGRRIGNGNFLLLGTAMAVGSLILLATTSDLMIIYLSNMFRGGSEVIIYASSYTIASVLIPPERRAKLFGVFNATYFLSWGIPGTFIVGPITDILIIYGAAEVFAYQMAFTSAAVITFIGLVIQGFLAYVLIPKAPREIRKAI